MRGKALRLVLLLGIGVVSSSALARSTPVSAAPQTVVTLNPAFQDVYSIAPADFTVTYSGGNDGAVVVIQYGDGSIAQATASGYTATFSHVYGIDRAYAVSAQVFASECLAPCTASATVLSAFQNCWTAVGGICMSAPPLLPSISLPNGVPDASRAARRAW